MSRRTKAELFLLSCTMIWGGTFPIVKTGLDDVPPILFVALRFTLATLLFLPFVAKSLGGMSKATLKGGILIGFLLFVGFVTQTVGLQYTTASKSGFITGLLVVFTPIFQILIERKAPTVGNIIGVLLVTAGLYLLTSPEGSGFNKGDALVLVCAAVFGLYIVFLDIVSKEGNVWHLSFIQFAMTAVGAGVGSLLFEHLFIKMTTGFIAAISYLTVLATLYTLTIQTRFQKDTSPTRAAVIFSIEPVFAAIFSFLFLGERIGASGIAGGGLVVGGLLVSELSGALFKKGRDSGAEA